MKKKSIIIIIILFIVVIISTILITLRVVKDDAKEINRIKIKEQENINYEEKEILKDSNRENNKENKKIDTIDTVKENRLTTEISSSNETKDKNKLSEDKKDTTELNTEVGEEDVVEYVEKVSNNSVGDQLKDGFITIVDFLFYDGKIYDKTFKELSNNAKIKVIKLALKIDSKIDEYFPEYKENISKNTNKVYTNLKSKLITIYLDTTVKICNNNPTLCDDAKDGLEDLKQNFGITWDFIKDISDVGIKKLKDWYEVWKEE